MFPQKLEIIIPIDFQFFRGVDQPPSSSPFGQPPSRRGLTGYLTEEELELLMTKVSSLVSWTMASTMENLAYRWYIDGLPIAIKWWIFPVRELLSNQMVYPMVWYNP